MAHSGVFRILYLIITVWAFILFCMSAGCVAVGITAPSTYNDGVYIYDTSSHYMPPQTAAILVFGILTWIYFLIATVLLFIKRGLPVIADIIVLCCLFIFGLGTVGAFSALIAILVSGGMVPLFFATAAFGWILVFLILGTLIFEVVVVIRGYGFTGETLRTNLTKLEEGGKTRGLDDPYKTEASSGLMGTQSQSYAAMPASGMNTYSTPGNVAPHTYAAPGSMSGPPVTQNTTGPYSTPYATGHQVQQPQQPVQYTTGHAPQQPGYSSPQVSHYTTGSAPQQPGFTTGPIQPTGHMAVQHTGYSAQHDMSTGHIQHTGMSQNAQQNVKQNTGPSF